MKTFFGAEGAIAKWFASMGHAFARGRHLVEGGQRTIATIGNQFRAAQTTTGKVAQFIGKVVGTISKVFKWIAKPFKSVQSVSRLAIGFVEGFLGPFKAVVKFASKFGTILGKIAWPLMVIMSVIDAITGFIDGWKKEEGGELGIAGQFAAGFVTAAKKVFQGLVGIPLDLLKDLLSWALKGLGFGEASKLLDKFSFTKFIGDIFDSILDILKTIMKSVKDMAAPVIEFFMGTEKENLEEELKENKKAAFANRGKRAQSRGFIETRGSQIEKLRAKIKRSAEGGDEYWSMTDKNEEATGRKKDLEKIKDLERKIAARQSQLATEQAQQQVINNNIQSNTSALQAMVSAEKGATQTTLTQGAGG